MGKKLKYIILSNTMYEVKGRNKKGDVLTVERFIICVARPLSEHELIDNNQFQLAYPIFNKFLRVIEIYEDKKTPNK